MAWPRRLAGYYFEYVLCVSVGIRSRLDPRSSEHPIGSAYLGASFRNAAIYHQHFLYSLNLGPKTLSGPGLDSDFSLAYFRRNLLLSSGAPVWPTQGLS